MGESGVRAVVAAYLAASLAAQHRNEEALLFAEIADGTAEDDDLAAHVVQRTAKARVLARRGRVLEAEALAREAVALAAPTDFVDLEAKALVALGDVLATAQRHADARDAVAAAHKLYEQKANVVLAGRVGASLAEPVR
jgi:tetratricopeptide (TPR) repeat protein